MPEDEHSDNVGYGLIGAFAFVFIGSAVRLKLNYKLIKRCELNLIHQILTAWYEHLTFRVGAMIRGGLIGLIYSKVLRLSTSDLNESSALALMGNDIETLAERANALLIEAYANSLTVGIAVYMLYAQLGPVCVAPIVMAISKCFDQVILYLLLLLTTYSLHCAVLVHWKSSCQTPDCLPKGNAESHQLHL